MLTSILFPILQSVVFITLIALIREPHRQWSMAILLAVAGGVYLNNEYQLFPAIFALVIGIFSFLGLKNYQFIGIGWLLHSVYDWVHYFNGFPMLNNTPGTAFGCAIFDIGIAVYFLLGAPTLFSKLSFSFYKN